jgi:hypothetical protein
MRRCLLAVAWLLGACAGAAPHANPAPPGLPPCPPEEGIAQESPAVGSPVAIDSPRGAIQGVARDKRTGRPISDVTVVAMSPEGPLTELTDASGKFLLADLPAGTHELTFYYGEIRTPAARVTVEAGRATPVSISLDLRQPRGPSIHARAPLMTTDGASYTSQLPPRHCRPAR